MEQHNDLIYELGVMTNWRNITPLELFYKTKCNETYINIVEWQDVNKCAYHDCKLPNKVLFPHL